MSFELYWNNLLDDETASDKQVEQYRRIAEAAFNASARISYANCIGVFKAFNAMDGNRKFTADECIAILSRTER